MKTLLSGIVVACALFAGSAVAQISINGNPANTSPQPTDVVACAQAGAAHSLKCTLSQIVAGGHGLSKTGDAMTGNLYLVTPSPGDNSTLAASTAFVDNAIAGIQSGGGSSSGAPVTSPLLGSSSTGALQTVTIGLGLNLTSGALNLNNSFTLSPSAGTEPLQIVQTGINQDAAGLDVRRTVNQSGGTAGWVNNAIRAYTVTAGTSSNYEWALTARTDNSSTGSAQDVGGYLQGRCEVSGCSPTWGGVSEAVDFSGQTNPSKGLIGHEIDVEGDGADNSSNRVVLDMYCKQHDSSSTYAVCGNGLRVSSQGNAEYNNAILAQGNFYTGLLINGNGSSEDVFGLRLLGNFSGPAIDLSSASLGADAIKLAKNQKVGLEGTDAYGMVYNPSSTGQSTIYNSHSVETFGPTTTEGVGLQMDLNYEGLRAHGFPMVGYDSEYAVQYNGTNLILNKVLAGTIAFNNGTGAKVGFLADQGLYFDSVNMSLRALNASGSGIYFQSYNGSAIWGHVDGVGWTFNVPASFQSTVQGTTPAAGDSSTNLATTAFVQNAVGGSWASYTPTVTSYAGGTYSYSASGRYKIIGKTVNMRVQVNISSTNGNGSGPLVGLPVISSNTIPAVCSGLEANSNYMLVGNISPNASVMGVSLTNGSFNPGSDTFTVSCAYEAQ